MKFGKKYDVIVAGGGLAGVFSAIACAREGLKVLILERYGFLGGMAASGLVNPFMKYYAQSKENGKEISVNNAGLFKCLLDRLTENNSLINRRTFNEEILKIILDCMVLENNVDLLFHSFVFEVEKENNRIKSIKTAGKSGVIEFEADYFIDATGDADVAYLSNCETKTGRDQDGLCQPMTTCFRLKKSALSDSAQKMTRTEINNLYNKAQKDGKIKNPRENVLIFGHVCPDISHFNSTRIVGKSAVDVEDLTEAEFEGRRQIFELYNFMRDNIPEYKDCVLLQIAPQVGVRESRRIVGKYVLTSDDIINCVQFEDSIARACYDIDIHNPAGTGTVIKRIKGDYYTIPLRSLIPIGVDNLAVAGRPISCDHEAHSSLRVMPIASSIGEAAGCAVAVAADKKQKLENVDFKEVQNMLKKYGAIF